MSSIYHFQESQISECLASSDSDHPHIFQVSCKQHGRRIMHTLSADNLSQYQHWWDGLQQHLLDQG